MTPSDGTIFVKSQRILLKTDLAFDEKWVQEQIGKDPSILGLGELILKDKERMQPRAGRLDLLLQDPDSNRRYEVELQLGETDEKHIIRTIEYWDIERKRYPQYDHCAVIVAEQITARFLNVVALFNGTIPLIAIQMSALKIGEQFTLVFTTIMDELQRGLVDEDEELAEVTDRAYWESRGSKATVAIADKLLEFISGFVASLELKYNKFYIGLAKNGQPNNFVIFRAKKTFMKVEPRLTQSPTLTKELEDAGLDLMEYDKRWGRYRIRVKPEEANKCPEVLKRLIKMAYEESGE
jgi:hypothetical protein